MTQTQVFGFNVWGGNELHSERRSDLSHDASRRFDLHHKRVTWYSSGVRHRRGASPGVVTTWPMAGVICATQVTGGSMVSDWHPHALR